MQRNFIRQSEKPSSLASQLTYQWCSTSLDYFTDYQQACINVSKAAIKEYVTKYITGKNYVAGLIINEQMNKAANTAEFFKPN